MARFLSRWSAFLALASAMLTVSGIPAHASPVPLFGSCQDIRNSIPNAPDGNYLLFNNGNLFTVYCYKMATNPSEYVDLGQTGQNVNFSQYTAGGAAPGTNVRTTFTKLRIDPATLTVDIGDLTFASSAGSLQQGSATVTSMPYGVAFSCITPGDAAGLGNINLLNTPFQVNNTFAVAGFEAAGSATVSSSDQVVDLSGGGYCGWISPAPALYNPFNPSPGMYHLQLNCDVRDPVVGGQLCLHIGNPASVTMQVQQNGPTVVTIVRYKGRPVATLGTHDQIARSLGQSLPRRSSGAVHLDCRAGHTDVERGRSRQASASVG